MLSNKFRPYLKEKQRISLKMHLKIAVGFGDQLMLHVNMSLQLAWITDFSNQENGTQYKANIFDGHNPSQHYP